MVYTGKFHLILPPVFIYVQVSTRSAVRLLSVCLHRFLFPSTSCHLHHSIFPAVIQKFFFIIAVFSCIVNYFYLAPECFFPKFFPDFHYLAHYLAHFFAYLLLRLYKYGSKNGKQIYFSINQVSSLSAFFLHLDYSGAL